MTRTDLVRAIQEKIKAEISWVDMVVVAPQNAALLK
jgi:hypothetical protein